MVEGTLQKTGRLVDRLLLLRKVASADQEFNLIFPAESRLRTLRRINVHRRCVSRERPRGSVYTGQAVWVLSVVNCKKATASCGNSSRVADVLVWHRTANAERPVDIPGLSFVIGQYGVNSEIGKAPTVRHQDTTVIELQQMGRVALDRQRNRCSPGETAVYRFRLMKVAGRIVPENKKQLSRLACQQGGFFEFMRVATGDSYGWMPASTCVDAFNGKNLTVVGNVAEGQEYPAIVKFDGTAHSVATGLR